MSISEYTILLIQSYIKENPTFIREPVSLSDIHHFSKKHKIENIVLSALKYYNIPIDNEILEEWEDTCDNNFVSLMIQENEKNRLVEILNEAKIKYLPLKGWHLRSMYPKPEFRFMSDFDILIDKSDRKRISSILRQHNYTGGIGDYGSDDSYYCEPCVHLEVHIDMVSVEHDLWYKYYQNIWDKAIQVSDYEYRLNWNDYFIYMMINFLKDYTLNGTGIRSILDFYVFLSKHRNDLDIEYINAEFNKLQVTDLANQTLSLVDKWFGDNPVILGDEMGDKLLSSEAYGTSKELVQHRYEKLSRGVKGDRNKKVVFLLRRAFPEMKIMKYKYPILNKVPVLLPACWIVSLVRYSDRAKMEIKTINDIDDV